MPSGIAHLWLPVAVFAVSLAVTVAGLAYARRRNLLDHPGARRSHRVPTPRGGGIGIVCGVLAGLILSSLPSTAILAVAVLLVAAIGWIDDHRSLGVRVRLAVHMLAAVLVAAVMPDALATIGIAAPIAVALAGLSVLAVVWSINLHNFMDGIDGLLATQALFVFATLAWLCGQAGQGEAALGLCVFAAATLGFLPFNFPRARVFMGDVGSGVLGLLVAVAVGWQLSIPALDPYTGLIACSAFVTDATATLLSRMVRGRRWYSAHREHLYQWLVRGGRRHAAVVARYAGWNLLVVLPVLYWINRPSRPVPPMTEQPFAAVTGPGLAAALGVYAVAGVLWWAGKRRCLRQARQRSRHAV